MHSDSMGMKGSYGGGVGGRRHRHVRIAVGALCLMGTFIVPLMLAPGEKLQRLTAAGFSAERMLLPLPAAEWAHARHLVVVAGHAVYRSQDHSSAAFESEDSWFLEQFQHGQLGTMVAHIEQGVSIAAKDNSSLLLFSGGETRATAGPRSEALSYWEAADAHAWWGHSAVRERAQLEEQARDSLENLLFSICRFHEMVNSYPDRITVVSFGFKRHRFEHVHRAALRFPKDHFTYIGIDPPGLPPTVLQGELSQSLKPFENDPYGCKDATLRGKRAARNPFRRSLSYPQGCLALAPLIAECPTKLYTGPLPWDR